MFPRLGRTVNIAKEIIWSHLKTNFHFLAHLCTNCFICFFCWQSACWSDSGRNIYCTEQVTEFTCVFCGFVFFLGSTIAADRSSSVLFRRCIFTSDRFLRNLYIQLLFLHFALRVPSRRLVAMWFIDVYKVISHLSIFMAVGETFCFPIFRCKKRFGHICFFCFLDCVGWYDTCFAVYSIVVYLLKEVGSYIHVGFDSSLWKLSF